MTSALIEPTQITNLTNIRTNKTSIQTNTTNISTNTSNISNNTSNIKLNKGWIDRNLGYIQSNGTNISTHHNDINTNKNDITNLLSTTGTNTNNIASNTSKITADRAKLTALRTRVGALEISHTLTKTVHEGSQTRKAGTNTAADNTNKCAKLTVPANGTYLISYHVIIQPTDIYYNQRTVKNSWYYTPDAVNLDLHTALYRHIQYSNTTIISGTSVTTDGGHYNKNNSHHIFRQAVDTLTKGDTLKILSYCNDFVTTIRTCITTHEKHRLLL